MKKIATNIVVAASASLAFFFLVSYVKSNPANDAVPVGTVIYSVIPPEDFLVSNKGWAKLDGAKLDPESQLGKIATQTRLMRNLNGYLPNASGMFLRSMNYNSLGYDPDKNRDAGERQADMLKEHRHLFAVHATTDIDTHSHEFSANDNVTQLNYQDMRCTNACDQAHGTDLIYSKISSYTSNYVSSYDPKKHTLPTSHSHKINYSDTTGLTVVKEYCPETRPANIALYAYIKVN